MRGQPSGGDGSTGLDAVIEALGLASYRELLAARWEESAVAGPLPGWPAEGQIREACASSFEDAAPFFARHFPEHGARALTCHSWLMDPQLRLYLPEAANIILFQKRFYLLPAERAGPAPHFERVFGVPAPRDAAELDELERKIGFAGRRSSAVERALIEHMRRGLVWRSGAGLIPLAASPSA